MGMGIFQDVELEWRGERHVIPAARMMGAIASIEEVITLKELFEAGARRRIKMSSIACAYGAVLRYAGAKVGDDEVYAGMFGKNAGAEMTAAIQFLLAMMVPPSGTGLAVEKPPKGKSPPAATPRSRKPTN